MRHFIKLSFLIFSAIVFSGCSSQSITPNKDEIKVGRGDADKDCKPLGKVTGASISLKTGHKESLEDMKTLAANKGATYIKVLQYSDNGGSVTGLAYQCN